MNPKEINQSNFKRSIKSRDKDIYDINFQGYYQRKIEEKFAKEKIGLTFDCSFLRFCEKSKTEIHNSFICKKCMALNYLSWKRLQFKNGFKVYYCDCCLPFEPPLQRQIKKSNLIKEISYSEGEDEEQSLEQYEDNDIEERYVRLGDYL
jgi:hypothetical protein